MMCLALGAKCGGLIDCGLAPDAFASRRGFSSDASAIPPMPNADCLKKCRRVMLSNGSFIASTPPDFRRMGIAHLLQLRKVGNAHPTFHSFVTASSRLSNTLHTIVHAAASAAGSS